MANTKESVINTDSSNQDEAITVKITAEQLEILNNFQKEKEKLEEKNKQVEEKLKELSDKELRKESLSTNRTLKNTQKTVTLTIPIDKRNPKDLVVPVTINGYTWQIKRGEKVEVPEEVERILHEAKYI